MMSCDKRQKEATENSQQQQQQRWQTCYRLRLQSKASQSWKSGGRDKRQRSERERDWRSEEAQECRQIHKQFWLPRMGSGGAFSGSVNWVVQFVKIITPPPSLPLPTPATRPAPPPPKRQKTNILENFHMFVGFPNCNSIIGSAKINKKKKFKKNYICICRFVL